MYAHIPGAARPVLALASGLLLSLAAYGATRPAAPEQPPPKIALVVLDKHCATVVQPWDLKSNTKVLAGGVLKRSKAGAMKLLDRAIGGLGGEKTDKAADKAAAEAEKKTLTQDTRNEAKQLNWLPMNVEVMYGERAHEQMKSDVLERDSKLGKKLYAQADELLAKVSGPVEGQHEYKWQLFILKNPSDNAMARPGGFLYIDRGLIDNSSLTLKARFALAHEIGHVLQRHETRELQGLIIDSFTAKDEMERAIANAKTDPTALLKNVKVGKDIYVRHQVDQELQADSCAARLLSEAFPERGELAQTVKGFLDKLEAAPAAAMPTKNQAGASATGGGATGTAPAMAAAVPASMPATSATAAQTQEKANQVAGGLQMLSEIVEKPQSRHPNAVERKTNLEEILGELSQPAQAAS
ncbi:MAG: M48 family metalloprotease [Gammaproteobacteria bacterium]